MLTRRLKRLRPVRDPSRLPNLEVRRAASRRARAVGIGLCLSCALCVFPAPAQSNQDSAYARAEALVRNHHWDEGIEVLEPLLKGSPRNLKLLNLAGLAYTGKGDPKVADGYFQSALKVSADFVPALKNLAINEAALGQIQPAREHFETALRQAPDDPVVHLYLGELLYRQQDYKQAAEHLHRAGDFVTRNPDLLASLAVTELKTGNQPASIELFNRLPPSSLAARSQVEVGVALAEAELSERAIPYLDAARIAYPAAADVSYDLALCYMSAKRFPEAISLLQTLSGSGHETAEIDNLLAEAYEANHETQHAVDALRRAIARSPEDDDNYLEFASICIDHQAFDDAAKVLAVGLGVHPKSARLFFERGILNAMQDHFDLAEADFQSSADLAPEDNSAYIGLGITLLQTGDVSQAVTILRRRLHDHPDDANLSYLLGESLLRAGAQDGDPAYAEAQTSLEKAVRLDPKLVEAHISLGTIYVRHERFADAVGQLEQARQLDPKAKSALSHLAIAYRRLGQQDKSKEVLVELKEINDRERTGSRQPMKSEEIAPALPTKVRVSGTN